MLLWILLSILLLTPAIPPSPWGYRRYGYVTWAPFGTILLLFLVLWFTGVLIA